MTVATLFRKPSAFLPVAISLVALLLVLAYVATVGVKPQADEGAVAHLWQLLMVAQLPLIAYWGVRWVPTAPRQGLIVLITQLAFALVAAAPVVLLGFRVRATFGDAG
jgi:hypothetical protein